jgi:hypothetical protein
MGAPRTTRSTFRRSRAVGLGDVAHRLRGDGLRRASQGPCPLDNLGRLIANHYLERPPSGGFFIVQLPRLETRQVHAPGLSIAKPRCLRAPRLNPQARGSFWPRIHRPNITAFAERCVAKGEPDRPHRDGAAGARNCGRFHRSSFRRVWLLPLTPADIHHSLRSLRVMKRTP